MENRSNGHTAIQNILLNEWVGYDAWQEVPLKYLVQTDSIMFIDWYIPSLKLCIELQGQQHYKATSFSSHESAIDREFGFIASKNRDRLKANLLRENGFLFMEIPYTDFKKIDSIYLSNKLKELM